MDTNSKQFAKMTETPVKKLVISLGIPTTISMLVTNIYNMADTFFIGQISTSASGAVGIVFGLMAILQAFGFMYGQGAGSIISRRLGGKDVEQASIYGSTSLFLAIITGIIIATFGLFNLEKMLVFFGSTPTILPYAKSYAIYIIAAGPFIMASFVLNNVLRFEGKASMAMIGLVTGGIINIAFDPILIFGFKMGIAGAGLATAISQFISFCILLSMFVLKKSSVSLSPKYIRIKFAVIWEIVTTGFPSMIRQGLASISTILLNRLAGDYTDACIAAMSIVNRLNFFMFAIGLGMGQGFQPVCGFNYGAKRMDRVKEAFFFTLILEEITLGILATIGFIFAPELVHIFRDDPEVVRIGKQALRFSCIALLVQPLCVMSNMTFQATGQKKRATFTAMLRSGLYYIPLLIVFSKKLGETGLILTQPFSDLLTFVTVLPFIIFFIKKLDDKQATN